MCGNARDAFLTELKGEMHNPLIFPRRTHGLIVRTA
jgi:hypothetical protein